MSPFFRTLHLTLNLLILLSYWSIKCYRFLSNPISLNHAMLSKKVQMLSKEDKTLPSNCNTKLRLKMDKIIVIKDTQCVWIARQWTIVHYICNTWVRISGVVIFFSKLIWSTYLWRNFYYTSANPPIQLLSKANQSPNFTLQFSK